jgi:two-component system chemotaxis response regulator CheB
VVDDSAVVRGLIARHLGADPEIEVVATAANGEIALLELQRREVDVVILDVEMPVMDGLTALGRIRAEHPAVKVIMASALTRRNAEISLQALSLGAADYVPKPEGGLARAEAFQRELTVKAKALGLRRAPAAAPAPAAAAARPVQASPRTAPPLAGPRAAPSVLAIGASTGGPNALAKLFESLRGAAPQPILLTQHMPATFTSLLAEQLARAGGRPCAEGRDGEPVVPGRCYVAPGGWHMTVDREGALPVIRLNQEPPENFCRPAVDPMMRSVARVYGAGALAVVLTGMGSDGAKGCTAVAQAGGRVVVQDEATSVVWGMPGAAAATGLCEAVLPLPELGPWLRRATGAQA